MNKFRFCEQFVYLDRRPISFEARPYLPAIYAADDRNLVLRSSRQTEKSTFLVNVILSEACQRPGSKILFVSPRREQALLFARARLLTSLDQSPLLRRRLLGKRGRRPQVTNMEFANGSLVHMRAAFHSGDACRGVSADLLLVDEFQDIAAGDLPILEETMSHARNGRTILTGTPKSVDNHLEGLESQRGRASIRKPAARCSFRRTSRRRTAPDRTARCLPPARRCRCISPAGRLACESR